MAPPPFQVFLHSYTNQTSKCHGKYCHFSHVCSTRKYAHGNAPAGRGKRKPCEHTPRRRAASIQAQSGNSASETNSVLRLSSPWTSFHSRPATSNRDIVKLSQPTTTWKSMQHTPHCSAATAELACQTWHVFTHASQITTRRTYIEINGVEGVESEEQEHNVPSDGVDSCVDSFAPPDIKLCRRGLERHQDHILVVVFVFVRHASSRRRRLHCHGRDRRIVEFNATHVLVVQHTTVPSVDWRHLYKYGSSARLGATFIDHAANVYVCHLV